MNDFERESELVPRDLPSRLATAISLFIIALTATTIAIAVLVPFPESLTCPFVLTPEGGADPVKAPLAGAIERVEVSDGDTVSKGDILFTIRSKDYAILRARVDTLERQVAAKAPLLEATDAQHRTSHRAAQVRVSSLVSELEFVKSRKKNAARLRTLAEKAFKKALISEDALLRERQADVEAGRELERLRRSLAEARVQVVETKTTHTADDAKRRVDDERLAGELAEAKAALTLLQRHVDQGAGNVIPVTAPYDGIITGMAIERAGPDVTIDRGVVLCQIARAGARLRAQLAVPELDAGRVTVGQPVKLMLDAFPYPRFGTRSATVAWVSPSAYKGSIRTRANIIDATVVVDGKTKPLQPGMKGTARIITGERTLAAYAFEPLRQLRENIPHSKQ